MKETYVSVYGTLRKGEIANYIFKDSEFISETKEMLPFKMVDLGSFPALMTSDKLNELVIETYLVKDKEILDRLDMYEGYSSNGNGLYDKKQVELKSGIKSWIYFMNSNERMYHGELIKSGDWKNK